MIGQSLSHGSTKKTRDGRSWSANEAMTLRCRFAKSFPAPNELLRKIAMKDGARGRGFVVQRGSVSAWLIQFFAVLLGCSISTLLRAELPRDLQFSYDGYEAFTYHVYFERAGYNEGELKLRFTAEAEKDYHLLEWVRPDSRYLGYRVTLEVNDEKEVAVFQSAKPGSTPIRIGRVSGASWRPHEERLHSPGAGMPLARAMVAAPCPMSETPLHSAASRPRCRNCRPRTQRYGLPATTEPAFCTSLRWEPCAHDWRFYGRTWNVQKQIIGMRSVSRNSR